VITGSSFLRQHAAGQRRAAVDQHRAAAADAGAADEVELQRSVQLVADLGQRDEQRHARRVVQFVGLPVGATSGCAGL
jgi:hypothetical protein